MIYYAHLPNPTAPDACALRACRRNPRVRSAWLAAFILKTVRETGFAESTRVREEFGRIYGLALSTPAVHNRFMGLVKEGRLVREGRGLYREAGPPRYRDVLRRQDPMALQLFDVLCKWEGAFGDADRLARRSGIPRRLVFAPLRRLVADQVAAVANVNGRRAWRATQAGLEMAKQPPAAPKPVANEPDIFS